MLNSSFWLHLFFSLFLQSEVSTLELELSTLDPELSTLDPELSTLALLLVRYSPLFS